MQNISVTVYTKPGCAHCLFTGRKLDKLGVPHTFVDVTEDPQALAAVQRLGHNALPVVVVDQNPAVHWSGHREERLESLV